MNIDDAAALLALNPSADEIAEMMAALESVSRGISLRGDRWEVDPAVAHIVGAENPLTVKARMERGLEVLAAVRAAQHMM